MTPVMLHDADSYAAQLREARRGDRQLRRAPRRDRAPASGRGRRARRPAADRRRRAARRGHGAGRAAQRAAVPLRDGVPRRAAGVPDPDDEGEPEVLPAARRRGPADQPASWSSATSARPTPAASIDGNERVVRPRLADAKFFFDQDRKKTLASRVPALAKVVYHGKLGTQGERVERVRAIARRDRASSSAATALARRRPTAPRCSPRPTCSPTWSASSPSCRASWAATTRATTARPTTSPSRSRTTTSRASPATRCRATRAGVAVALADKLETLAGLFGIGQLPTGDKDPFALRRHALGVIRMLIERELPLDWRRRWCAWPSPPSGRRTARRRPSWRCFLRERLVGYLREQGYSAQEVDAVLDAAARSAGPRSPSAARGRARLRGAARGRRRWPRPTSASATS